jgi:FkbM family methyltransferase
MRALILDHDLAGILVEPLPDLFARLRANYADRPKLHFENVAIGSEDGAMTIYRVRPDTPNAPRWWFDLASVDSSFMARHGVPAAVVETLTVPSITFQTLLGRHGKTHVDLLQVDTEGHDSIIVRAALAAGFSPGIINFESCHLPPSDRYELKQSLAAHGYRFIDIDRDTLAVRVELDGETAAPNGRQGG